MESQNLAAVLAAKPIDSRPVANTVKTVSSPVDVVGQTDTFKANLVEASVTINNQMKAEQRSQWLKSKDLPPRHPKPDVVKRADRARTQYANLVARENDYKTLAAEVKAEAKFREVLRKAASKTHPPFTPDEEALLTEATDKGLTKAMVEAKARALRSQAKQHITDVSELRDKQPIDAGALGQETNDWKLLEAAIVEQQKQLQAAFKETIEIHEGTAVNTMTVGEALSSKGVNQLDWKFKQAALTKLSPYFERLNSMRESSVRVVGRVAEKGGKWVDPDGDPVKIAKAYAESEAAEQGKGTEVDLGKEEEIVTSANIETQFNVIVQTVEEQMRKVQGDKFTLSDENKEKLKESLRKRLGVEVVKDQDGKITEWKASEKSPIRSMLLWEDAVGKIETKFNEDLAALEGNATTEGDRAMAEGTYWMGALKVQGEAVQTGLNALVAQEGFEAYVDVTTEQAKKDGNWEQVKKIDEWLGDKGKDFRGARSLRDKAFDLSSRCWFNLREALKDPNFLRKAGKVILYGLLAILATLAAVTIGGGLLMVEGLKGMGGR